MILRPYLLPCVLLASGLACAEAGDRPSRGATDPAATPTDHADFERLRNHAFQLMEGGGEAAAVLEALQAAHAADPTAFGVNQRLARVLLDARRHEEALEHFEAASRARPEDPGVRREAVVLAVSVGRAELALELVEPLLADPAGEGEGRTWKARALDHLGRRDEALAVLSGAADLPPDQAGPALSLWARMLLEDGDFAGARQRFEQALAAVPDDQSAVRGLADACRRQGDAAAARRWDEVLTLLLALRDNFFTRHHDEPEDKKAQRQAGRRSDYIGGELALREERLRRLIALHPDWPGAWEQLAEVLRRDGRADEACEVVEQLMARHADAVDETTLRERYCEG